MRRIRDFGSRRRLASLRMETLLGLSCLSLAAQLCPPAFWLYLDARSWSSGSWFALFAAMFISLLMIRFHEEIWLSVSAMGARPRRSSGGAKSYASEKTARLSEERELYERMNEARKRQIIYQSKR